MKDKYYFPPKLSPLLLPEDNSLMYILPYAFAELALLYSDM